MMMNRNVLLLLFFLAVLPLSSHAATKPADAQAILVHMADDSENMVNTALEKNVSGTRVLYKNIQQNLEQLHHRMADQPFDEHRSRELIMAYSWMRVIAIDLKQQAWVGTAIAANQLSASMIRFTQYSTLIKRDIAWMGYLGRELLLLNMEGAITNAQLLDIRRADLAEVWNRVAKALIIQDFRNKGLIFQGNVMVRLLQKNHTPRTTIATARKLLVFVDKLAAASTGQVNRR